MYSTSVTCTQSIYIPRMKVNNNKDEEERRESLFMEEENAWRRKEKNEARVK